MANKKSAYDPEVKRDNPKEEEPKESKEVSEGGTTTPSKEVVDKKEGKEEGKEESKEKIKEEDKDIEDKDIPMRNSASQVIARQKRTIEKLRSKDEEDEGADFEPPTGEDEELTLEAKGAVQGEVERQLKPVIDSLGQRTDEDELQGLFDSDPESKKYEKRIRAYMKVHPTSTPEMIFHHLAFDEAETTGSRKKKVADTDAKQQRGGGTGIREVETEQGGVPSVEEQDDMTDEEFDKVKDKALQGDFVPKE